MADVAAVLKSLAESAAKAKASQAAAAAKARLKTTISDADAGPPSLTGQPVNKDAYDFESHPAETDLHAKPAINQDTTKILKAKAVARNSDQLEAIRTDKAQADNGPRTPPNKNYKPAPVEADTAVMSANKPARTIAQELSEIKPSIPMKPLAGQGSMEGKPVEKVTIKVPHVVRKEGGTPPPGVPERRSPVKPEATPGEPGKAMTPSGKVEVAAPAAKAPVVDSSVADAYRASMKAGEASKVARAYGSTTKAYNPASSIARSEMSLGQRAAAKFGSATESVAKAGVGFAEKHPNVVKAAVGTGKVAKALVSPFTDAVKDIPQAYRGLKAARAAKAVGTVAKAGKAVRVGLNAGNLALQTGWGIGKGVAKEAVIPAVLTASMENSAAKITDKLSAGADAMIDQKQRIAEGNKAGAKYGFNVTGNTSLLASVFGRGPNIKVTENPQLKKAFMDKNRKRIRAQLDER